MSSLGGALASTMRPWRSLYACACCYLLPLSSAMRLATSTARSAGFATRAAAAAARYSSSSRRPSGLSAATPPSWAAGRDSSRLSAGVLQQQQQLQQPQRHPCGKLFAGGGAGCVGGATTYGGARCPLVGSSGGGSSRTFSGGKRPKLRGRARWERGRAGALGMGKGLGRKKAKKEQAAANKAAGKGTPAPKAAAQQSVGAAAAGQVAVQEISDKEGFLGAFETLRKAKAPKKIFQAFSTAKRNGIEGLPDLAAAAVKEELKLSRVDLARSVIETLGAEQWDAWLARHLDGAQAVVRCACAASEAAFAEELIAKAGFSCGGGDELAEEFVSAATSVYPNLITAFSRNGKRGDAMRLLEAMANARLPVKTPAANRLLQGFHKRRDLEAVFKVLDVMAAAGVDGDDETYEWLANAAVRGVDFVKGAVSMATLPKEPVLPEAAFIGRSNVGKSSLINMVCNRKALAFTSKRPGKTQQFNYFLMNNNTENAFYLVDLPGMGYAKVPEKQRKEWSTLFRSYITRRSSLRVLFHLIDGRHGPVGQDHAIMKLMAELPDTARYVVVLTKADKSDNSVSRQVLEGVVAALREAGVSRTPVVLTSAASKLGRDGMWRYLRLAALDKAMREKEVANKEGKPGEDAESGSEGNDWTRVVRRGEGQEDAGLNSKPVSVVAGVSKVGGAAK
ncbi:YihA4, YihA/EngB-like GTPase [Ectocarpus siliculosus]|uniref:YihA4, YihA/EngB-like GTPase n=1 Tax=Ectocarpus siliculosus TaxID=2880 RepID=D7G7B8_ECTSI|nr:YihA4, YihA/EngB-like GTPase [Ectocarpus siliculosus]|eukprot:CBJ27669.1 YihA4, YihA/EngB-like GTPase [Ectocarpus siliculosus]